MLRESMEQECGQWGTPRACHRARELEAAEPCDVESIGSDVDYWEAAVAATVAGPVVFGLADLAGQLSPC